MEVEEYIVLLKIRSYRFVVTLHAILDLQHELAIVSLLFQSTSVGRDKHELMYSDILVGLDKAHMQLDRFIKGERGQSLKTFFGVPGKPGEFDEVAGTFRGVPLDDVEVGQAAFEDDWSTVCRLTKDALHERFQTLVANPVLQAGKKLYEHRCWPIQDLRMLKEHAEAEVRLLLRHFKAFFTTEEARELLADWPIFKRHVAREPFFNACTASEFWRHVAQHYASRHPLVIRMIVLYLMVPLDTSECERGFSLMNLLKTALRNRLGSRHLNDLMRICLLGPSIEDFDPKPIMAWWLRNKRRLASKFNNIFAL